jgi:hypothetical protein
MKTSQYKNRTGILYLRPLHQSDCKMTVAIVSSLTAGVNAPFMLFPQQVNYGDCNGKA